MDQQLPHLLLRPVVLGVGRLFLCHEPCKFFVQAPDRGQLFEAKRIKGFLRRLVDEDIPLMLRKVFFRVPRLAVLSKISFKGKCSNGEYNAAFIAALLVFIG